MGQPPNFEGQIVLDEQTLPGVSTPEHPSKTLLRTVFREEHFFLVLSVFIGIFSGLAVVCFRFAINWCRIYLLGSGVTLTPLRLILAPTLAGLVIAVLVIHLFPLTRGSGVNQTKAAYGEHLAVHSPRRTTFVGAFPIGIDYEEFAHGASDHEVTLRAHEIVERLNECRVILGVDRSDYTKGIPLRLAAYRYFLELHPERRQRVALVEVVVPSREDIPKYLELKTQIQRQVSEINGEYGEPGWVPIHYIHRSLDRLELLAYYRAAHIALITPLKDGMNLVAKEYCAARVHDDGVLILSEFAGSAFQLNRGALLVNPYDTRAVAEAIEIACDMPLFEQKKRIRKLKARVRQEDIFHWRDSFWGCGELATRSPQVAPARSAEQKSVDL
jgi:trehalose-6-phosphate synthase